MKRKKAVIVFSLVNESTEVKNEEIEEDIMNELSEHIVPWCKRVEKVVVRRMKSTTINSSVAYYFSLHYGQTRGIS